VTTANGSNNVYIADTWNNRVQEVAASSGMQWGVYMTAGDIYTVAGSASGLYGYSGNGGAATSALLNQPDQVTFDSSSNMYIADTGNDRVREVSASTTDISAYAGNGETLFDTGDGGSALAAGLWNPKGIATDTMGDLFVADHVNNRVQEIAASSHTQFGISMTAGDVYTVAGGGTGNVGSGYGGPATSASIGSVFGVALDSAGDLYVTNLTQVLEVPVASGTQWGISMTVDDIYDVAGSSYPGSSGDGGIATSAFLSSPAGVTFDSTGDLYIADAGNNRVQEVASHSGTQWGIAMTANHIYTVAGSSTGAWGTSGDGGAATSALFNFDTSVALDQAGDIYIADAGNNRIQEVAASTGTQWGVPMTAGDVYTVAGSASGSLGASGDGGAATSALLGEPEGVTVDPAGDLYIADSGNNRIREVAAANGVQ
jgi:secreted PhoX family phosphatase